MSLNIKNPDVDRLLAEVTTLTGESKTEAVRRALEERSVRLRLGIPNPVKEDRVRRFLAREVWSRVPRGQQGRPPDKAEREAILGYGGEGV